MSKIDNLAEEFLVEEEFLSEELNKFYTTQQTYTSQDINEFCCIKNVDGVDFLSVLQNKTIYMKELPKKHYIQISQEYVVNKIILHHVPDSVYTFTMDGQNITTFKKITNFPKLNDYLLDIKNITFRNGSFDDHIDLTKINIVRISYQKGTFNDDDVIHYSLYGYKYNILNQTFEKQNTKYKYFINTIQLFLNNPTKFLTFYAKTIDETKSGNIYLYIEGKMVNNICVNSGKNLETVKINFNNIDNYLKEPTGFEEKYLTEKIISETLNMSKINSVQVASSNVDLWYIIISFLKTYNMYHMNQIFCDWGP